MKKRALKGFLIVLVVMFLCTFISRAADSLTVARVKVDTISGKKIEHMVEAEGSVEKNRELAVLTEADLLVKTVYVSEGQSVEENDLLAEVDLSGLDQAILEVKNEIRTLELQNSQIIQSENNSRESKRRAQNRAKEDYNKAVQEHTAAVQKAQQELQQAKEALSSYEQQSSAKELVSSSGKNESTPENNAENDTGNNTENDTGNNAENDTGNDTEQEKNQAGETGQAEEGSQLRTLQSEVTRTQEAYDTAVAAYQQAILQATRQQEDADHMEVMEDTSVEINEMNVKEKEKKLERLEELQKGDGKITAPVAGVITQCLVSVGQKTSDTAAFTMADISSGMKFIAQISQKDSKYVQVGDEVTLKVTGKEISDLKVEAIEEAKEGEQLKVTVLLPAGTLSIGDSATLCVTKQSQIYQAVVPYSAIHSEENKDYVYVASQEQTILGNEYVVRAYEVEIIEKNERYAAIQEQGIEGDAKIITDSDRYIQAGSRIRLQNP